MKIDYSRKKYCSTCEKTYDKSLTRCPGCRRLLRSKPHNPSKRRWLDEGSS